MLFSPIPGGESGNLHVANLYNIFFSVIIFSHVPSPVWISFFHFEADDPANMRNARYALFAVVADRAG